MSPKLTKPQRELLRKACRGYIPILPDYRPARRLLELGLIRECKGRFSTYCVITDLGLQAGKELFDGNAT